MAEEKKPEAQEKKGEEKPKEEKKAEKKGDKGKGELLAKAHSLIWLHGPSTLIGSYFRRMFHALLESGTLKDPHASKKAEPPPVEKKEEPVEEEKREIPEERGKKKAA
jgi:hypothetical protein